MSFEVELLSPGLSVDRLAGGISATAAEEGLGLVVSGNIPGPPGIKSWVAGTYAADAFVVRGRSIWRALRTTAVAPSVDTEDDWEKVYGHEQIKTSATAITIKASYDGCVIVTTSASAVTVTVTGTITRDGMQTVIRRMGAGEVTVVTSGSATLECPRDAGDDLHRMIDEEADAIVLHMVENLTGAAARWVIDGATKVG